MWGFLTDLLWYLVICSFVYEMECMGNYFNCVKNILDFHELLLVKQIISIGVSLYGKAFYYCNW